MTIRAPLSIAATVLLTGAALGLLYRTDWAHHGAAIEPARLTLRAGEERVLDLVIHETDIVALGFRLRFDQAILAIESAQPEHASILAGGNAIHLPVRRQPGMLEVPGSAVTGGRVLEASAPAYRFVVRGLSPGPTTLAVEDLVVVDSNLAQRRIPVAPSHLTVRAR